MVKIVTVNEGEENEIGEYETLTSIEIRGATGGVQYRIDPKQDFLIKVVVNGNVLTHTATTKDGKEVDVSELQGLTPQDLPVPQIQTGDAGDSSKAVDVDGNPVYPELDEDGNPIPSKSSKAAPKEDPKPTQQPATAGAAKR